MDLTLSGISMWRRDEQRKKADSPIYDTVSGSETDVKFVHPEKALTLILVP